MESTLLDFLAREPEMAVSIGGKECAMRILSAREMLSLRAKVAEKKFSDDEERALWANGELLSMSLALDGKKLFEGADDVLEKLGIGEIAALVEQYARLDGRVNPSPEESREKIEALKKA